MLKLWNGQIPGFDKGIEQAEPSVAFYPADGGKLCGAVIVCPGGGYVHKAPHEGEPIALWLNSIGLAAFVLDYRVMPYRHPYPMLDAKRAVRYVRCHAGEWNIDPERIGILGFSAGGHLAATAATMFDGGDPCAADPVERYSSRPDAAVLCYPVITFGQYGHQGSMINLLGEEPEKHLVETLSLENAVSDNTPPCFLWHTANDAGVPVENSFVFASALSAHKVPFELHVFPEGRHGLGLAGELPEVAVWTDMCRRWFAKIGFIEAEVK